MAFGILVLLAIHALAGRQGSYARTCEHELGLRQGTAEFSDCYSNLQNADTEAKSLLFGGLIRTRPGG